MAGNTVNIDLNIRSNNTLRESVRDSEQYADNLARANREGAKASSMQYGRARGVAGITGASARDFANEQQGLGGLVQLYAKIAANTYAAAAAFNVLKNALDTTTMVEGLNQLGARSGQALGSLSLNLVKATGGAISLREAMRTVTQGTSAGLSSGQMLKLADTAKKASQALGIDMGDAISRLSRGITKLEPELLDELGIFTKIGPATEAYARSIGKTTASLTDFERRQAFANAVLKEGQEKFGSLDIPTNPYDQLLASLKNLAQSFLEIVNKVFTPFASLLANNSALLTAAVVGIGIKISKSLFPVLGTWRQELTATADLAKKKAAEMAGAYGQNFVERLNRSRQVGPLTQQLAQSKSDTATAMQAYLGSTTSKSQFTKNLRTGAGADLDIATAQKRLNLIEREKKALDSMTGPLTTQQQRKQKSYDSEIKSLDEVIKLKKKELDIQKQLVDAQDDAEHLANLGNRSADARDKIMKQTAARSERLNLLSKVAENTEQLGFAGAREKLKQGLAESNNMSKFSKFTTNIVGTAAAGATELAILAESFNPIIMGAEAAIGAFILLDSVFSENSKEIAAFTEAIDAGKEAIESATRTVESLNKQGALFPQTSQGLTAISNSFNALADSVESVGDTAKKAKEKMSTWDIAINWASKFVSKDVDSQLAKSLGEQVRSGITILNKTQIGREKIDLFKNLIKADSTSTEDLTKALKKLGDDAGPTVTKFFKEVGIELGNSSARLQNFKNTSEAVTKSYQEFIQSTASGDPMFKLAASIQANAVAMQQLKGEGIDEITAAMIDLAKSPEKGLFFGEKFITNLLSVREEFVQQATAIAGTEDALRYLDDQIETTTANYNKAKKSYDSYSIVQLGRYNAGLEVNKQKEALEGLKGSRAEVQKALDLLPRDKIEAAKNIFVEGLEGAFEVGAKYMDAALGFAAEKAAITIGRAKLGALSGEERAKQEAKLNLQELGIQEKLIASNQLLLNSQYKLTASIDLSNALKALETAKAEKKSQTVIADLESAVRVATVISEQAGKKGGPDIKKLPTSTKTEVTDYMTGQVDVQERALSKEEDARIRMGLLGQATANAAQAAALIGVQAQQKAAVIQGDMAARAGRYIEDIQKLLAIEQAINQTQLARINIVNSNLDTATKQTLQSQNALENSAQELKNKQELTELNVKLANALQYGTAEEVRKLNFQKVAVQQRQSEEAANLAMNQQIREINLKYHEQNILRQEALKTSQAQNALEQQRVTNQQGLLGVLQQAGALTGEFYAQESSRLAIQQARLEKTNAELQAQDNLAETLSKVNQQQEIAATAMTAAGEKLLDVSGQIKTTFEEIAKLVRDMVNLPKAAADAKAGIPAKTTKDAKPDTATKTDTDAKVNTKTKSSISDIVVPETSSMVNLPKAAADAKAGIPVKTTKDAKPDIATKTKSSISDIVVPETSSAGLEIYKQITGGYQSGYVAPSKIATQVIPEPVTSKVPETTTVQSTVVAQANEKEKIAKTTVPVIPEPVTSKVPETTTVQSTVVAQATEREKIAKTTAQEKFISTELQQAITKEVGVLRDKQQQLALNLSYQVKTKEVQKQLNDLILEGAEYLTKEEIQRKQGYETELFGFKQKQDMTALTDKRAEAQKALDTLKDQTKGRAETPEETKALVNIKERIRLYGNEITSLTEIQQIELQILGVQQEREKLKNRFIVENIEIEKQNTLNVIRLDLEKQGIDTNRQLYDASLERKNLTEDQIIQLEKIRKLQDADTAYNSTVIQIKKDIAAEEKKARDTFLLANADREDIDIASNQRYNSELNRITEIGNARLNAANKAKQSGIDIANAQGQYSARQLAYNDILKGSFDKLGDALADFVLTGKLNFKDLINSMIADLIRWEMKQQTAQLYSAFGGAAGIGRGIMGFLGLGGTAGNAGSTGIDMSGAGASTVGMSFAKGGAFDQDYPVHKFAMGGAFTNQVVNSPTLFKFASGTGLMGEAGPEAIMPLKRDNNGNLGVRGPGGGNNVQVVVNNNTGQKAETRETVDNRGQRTIEVTIGDMVAQQMSSKGSPVQQAMSNVYGNKPAIARR